VQQSPKLTFSERQTFCSEVLYNVSSSGRRTGGTDPLLLLESSECGRSDCSRKQTLKVGAERPAARLRQRCRRRKGLVSIDNEHDQRVQIPRLAY